MKRRERLDALFCEASSKIDELAGGDEKKREMLDDFFFHMLCVFDGVQGPDVEWDGISLVDPDTLETKAEEINDDFLHDEWTEWRSQDR